MATADSTRNIRIKEYGPTMKKATRKVSWVFGNDGPKTVEDLPFFGRNSNGHADWWQVIPPNTDYWHAHEILGRAYAFDLLDLMNNPEAEFPEHILSYIAGSMAMWEKTVKRPGAAEGIRYGFNAVLSEYMSTGRVNR